MYKEKISSLTGVIDSDDKGILDDLIECANNYISIVANLENAMIVAKFHMEANDYRRHIQNLDNNRRITHNALIASCNITNRLCKLYDLPPFFDIDLTDRHLVGDVIFEMIKELFEERR